MKETNNKTIDTIFLIMIFIGLPFLVTMITNILLNKKLDKVISYPTQLRFNNNLLRDGCYLNYFNDDPTKGGYDVDNPSTNYYAKTVLLVCETPFNQK